MEAGRRPTTSVFHGRAVGPSKDATPPRLLLLTVRLPGFLSVRRRTERLLWRPSQAAHPCSAAQPPAELQPPPNGNASAWFLHWMKIGEGCVWASVHAEGYGNEENRRAQEVPYHSQPRDQNPQEATPRSSLSQPGSQPRDQNPQEATPLESHPSQGDRHISRIGGRRTWYKLGIDEPAISCTGDSHGYGLPSAPAARIATCKHSDIFCVVCKSGIFRSLAMSCCESLAGRLVSSAGLGPNKMIFVKRKFASTQVKQKIPR